MTLKSFEYITYLFNDYSSICVSASVRPWPNPKTGLPASQYTFSTKSLPELTKLHSLWYKWDELLKKFRKIVPLNIGDLLTARGLANWIMDDGTASGNGVVLCTDSFTYSEVELLCNVLQTKFGLKAYPVKRPQKGKPLRWRIRISAESKALLHSIVLPYFIPSMLYKLSI